MEVIPNTGIAVSVVVEMAMGAQGKCRCNYAIQKNYWSTKLLPVVFFAWNTCWNWGGGGSGGSQRLIRG